MDNFSNFLCYVFITDLLSVHMCTFCLHLKFIQLLITYPQQKCLGFFLFLCYVQHILPQEHILLDTGNVSHQVSSCVASQCPPPDAFRLAAHKWVAHHALQLSQWFPSKLYLSDLVGNVDKWVIKASNYHHYILFTCTDLWLHNIFCFFHIRGHCTPLNIFVQPKKCYLLSFSKCISGDGSKMFLVYFSHKE